MKIKKGNLNFDQSGRAYPDEPQIQENWDCVWEFEGKHYKLVGDDEHKEWEEVNIYNQIIDEVYGKYSDSHWSPPENPNGPLLSGKLWSLKPMEHSKESFIQSCKTDKRFSERWGLKIEERELSLQERHQLVRVNGLCPKYSFEIEDGKPIPNKLSEDEWYNTHNVPTRAITVRYKDETIEVYE